MIKCKIHTACKVNVDEKDDGPDEDSGNEHALDEGKSGNPETAGTSNQTSSRET